MRPYLTSFCNMSHDLDDGRPIEHNCPILNVKALAAEADGRQEDCNEIGIVNKPYKEMVRGKRAKESK